MKHVKIISRDYAYGKVDTNDIIELLELFHAKKVIIKIENIRSDSTFCKNILQKKSKYVSFSDFSEEYVDIFISENIGEGFPNILNEIIDSAPEIVCLYLSDLSLEDFTHYYKTIFPDKLMKKKITYCEIAIMLDENILSVSFASDYLVSKVDEIIFSAQLNRLRKNS